MIAQDKILIVRHLIRQFDIALAVGRFHEIWLIQCFLIHIDGTIFIDIHPASRSGDHPLDQDLIILIESDNVALLEILAFYRDHHLPF